jgi:UDP-N-acetylmuramyl pentapeptide phosphotransferase/UDP-N-acetylglucosamine-1-phosphate transferase
MSTWLAAMAVAAAVAILLPPRFRRRAYRLGWFERSRDTDRPRSRRRPTHGGVAAALAVAAGSLFAPIDEPATRAALAGCAIALVIARVADRSKGPAWLVPASRVLSAAAVPIAGVEVDLTGSSTTDAVLLGLLALVVIGGLATLERTDGAAPAVTAVASVALVVVGARVSDPVVPVLAAVGGASLGLLVHSGAPSALRLGRSGPGALGTALVAGAFGLTPTVAPPSSVLVPVLVLLVPIAAAAFPSLAPRLAARRLPAATTLAMVTGAGAGAAVAVDGGDLDPLLAIAIALGALGLAILVSLTVRRPEGAPSIGRTRAWVLGATAGFALVVGLPAAWIAAGARDDMFTGKEHAEVGLAAVRDGDLDAAVAAFATADEAFEHADASLSSPLVRLAALLPGAAQNLGAARDLAEVGQELSTSAVAVSERARAEDLRVEGGRFPVEAAADVGARLTDARRALARSSARLDDLGSPWLVRQVADAVDSVTEAITDTESSVAVVAEATRLAPQLLGADADRRWFVAALSPSELRASGGILGDYALVTASSGTLDLERTAPVRELNAATDDLAMAIGLPGVYGQLYRGWNVHQFWQNLTVTPDFPTVGQAVANLYPLTGDGTVEGVIGIDPLGVAALLELTGPVEVPTWPEPITADNAAEILLFRNYDELAPEVIDEFQGDVLEAVVDALTDRDLPSVSELAATLAPAVGGGHLRFWSQDLDEQALFRMAGADGSAMPAELEGATDHLQVLTQSSSESKVDWYLRRSVTYDVAYDPTFGIATTTATVTLTNGAPAGGVSEYVIGGAAGGPTRPGENRLSLTLRTALPVHSATDGAGNPVAVSTNEEGGLHSTTMRTVIPPGGTVTYVVQFAGVVDASGGYRLAVGLQPTAWPDDITVTSGGVTQAFPSTEPVVVDVGRS